MIPAQIELEVVGVRASTVFVFECIYVVNRRWLMSHKVYILCDVEEILKEPTYFALNVPSDTVQK